MRTKSRPVESLLEKEQHSTISKQVFDNDYLGTIMVIHPFQLKKKSLYWVLPHTVLHSSFSSIFKFLQLTQYILYAFKKKSRIQSRFTQYTELLRLFSFLSSRTVSLSLFVVIVVSWHWHHWRIQANCLKNVPQSGFF